jgi:hypothetical protein
MSVEVSDYRPEAIDKIKEAAEGEWPFEDWTQAGERLSSYGESSLCSGETEEEFTEQLSVAVWRANGAYCQVVVTATYLENLPSETHSLNEDDYARLIQAGPEISSTGGKGSEENEDEVLPGG